KGSRGRNPLVPDWADDQPGTPLPPSDPNRYRSFRKSFGDYVSDGGGKAPLQRSLGKFASQATGGAGVGTRRLGRVISSGGAFGETLKAVADGSEVEGLDTSRYEGKSVDQFAQAIGELVAGDSPDADIINSAVQEAIEQVLDLDADFDPNALTDDNISQIMIEYLAQSIFQIVVIEAGNSWNRSDDVVAIAKCETEILDLTREHVEQSYTSQIKQTGINLGSTAVEKYMRTAALHVWQTWERYDD
ncbi:MAG: hypothetical protein AAGF25_10915, partial [Pseudomonadota bacterium]